MTHNRKNSETRSNVHVHSTSGYSFLVQIHKLVTTAGYEKPKNPVGKTGNVFPEPSSAATFLWGLEDAVNLTPRISFSLASLLLQLKTKFVNLFKIISLSLTIIIKLQISGKNILFKFFPSVP